MFPCEKHQTTMCKICFPECLPDCEWCPCTNCGCPMREHFEPDANMLAERGIDIEEAAGNGHLNYCGMCGDCLGSGERSAYDFQER